MHPALSALLLLSLAGCAAQGPLGLPPGIFGGAGESADHAERRGAVELFVKSNHTALIDDIQAGGGPVATQIFDIAGVPAQDRPARLLQLRGDLGLYAANPGALVTTLMIYARS